MVKLVDTPDLGSGAEECVGSSPILGTQGEDVSEMNISSPFFLSIPYKI